MKGHKIDHGLLAKIETECWKNMDEQQGQRDVRATCGLPDIIDELSFGMRWDEYWRVEEESL
eukprot:CAMPEP_0185781404 /NCGR_PEP_ID=MMETSP1174-20130828/102301_1 /TAXON_ID=35687 /ORGANISM="Dictyocha speculum, Strain CCMP1381" /LENGTH=61 /DNA_ID=CAMNT_0028471375 /DNA_START=1 /DNA_END=183 /DNA_ORIENTATION=-